MDTGISFLIGLGLVCYGGYHLYIMICHPAQYEAMKQRKHEREMAAAEERRAKAGNITGGILGGIAKAVIGASMKR